MVQMVGFATRSQSERLFQAFYPRNFVNHDEASTMVSAFGQAVDELGLEESLEVFPNPTAGEAQVVYTLGQSSDVTVEVTNALGQRVELRQLATGYDHVRNAEKLHRCHRLDLVVVRQRPAVATVLETKPL